MRHERLRPNEGNPTGGYSALRASWLRLIAGRYAQRLRGLIGIPESSVRWE